MRLSILSVPVFACVCVCDCPCPQDNKFDSLELTQEKINAITDKIPQRPVGPVEATSYSLIIVAAFGVGAWPMTRGRCVARDLGGGAWPATRGLGARGQRP